MRDERRSSIPPVICEKLVFDLGGRSPGLTSPVK
jgi:hypothetical protein